MVRWQREMPRPGNVKLFWQQLIILSCLNSARMLLALKMQFHGVTRIHRFVSMKMITLTTARKTLIGSLVIVMMSWQMTRELLNSLMAIWKMRSSMLRQERQRLFSCCWYWCFWGLAQPSEDRKLVKSRGERQEEQKERKVSLRKVEMRQIWVHLASCQNHRSCASSLALRCPRSVQVRFVQLEVDHITLLVPVLTHQCMLCRQVGHRASKCPNKGNRLLYHLEYVPLLPRVPGCAVFESQWHGANVEEI